MNDVRTRVYIAGPITQGDQDHNYEQAETAQAILLERGLAPLNPMLSMRHKDAQTISRDDWLAGDIPWVIVSDAVLRLPGASLGADGEVAVARDHGIPVYRDMGALMTDHLDGVFAKPDNDVIEAFKEAAGINAKPSPLESQVGGSHYTKCPIQPIEYIRANKLAWELGNVLKLIIRHADKGNEQDILKAEDYLRKFREYYYKGAGE